MKYPQHLLKLIEVLKKLPGVGNKSAERFAFQMLDWEPSHLDEMSGVIQEIPEKIHHCEECGCIKDHTACQFCSAIRQERGVICVIASAKDVFAVDETGEYKGLYHVLGKLLSPMDGIGPNDINISKLRNRVRNSGVHEVVIALDSTLEGDATALYIKQELEDLPIKITRLAFGLPMGSSLDFVDGGTLAHAFRARNQF